jgi:hypothetical protein
VWGRTARRTCAHSRCVVRWTAQARSRRSSPAPARPPPPPGARSQSKPTTLPSSASAPLPVPKATDRSKNDTTAYLYQGGITLVLSGGVVLGLGRDRFNASTKRKEKIFAPRYMHRTSAQFPFPSRPSHARTPSVVALRLRCVNRLIAIVRRCAGCTCFNRTKLCSSIGGGGGRPGKCGARCVSDESQ